MLDRSFGSDMIQTFHCTEMFFIQRVSLVASMLFNILVRNL